MPIRTQSADGKIHEFPDGTDGSVIDRVMKQYAQDNAPGLVSKAAQPLKNIPHDIAEEFRGGAKEISDTYKSQRETLDRGELPSKVSGLGYVSGGLREAMSPVTGAVKALVQDPVTNAASTVMPKHVSQFLGNLSGDAAAMFGPAAVGKATAAIADSMPGLNSSVKTLMDAGVKLTPGQIFRGVSRKVEDTARSIPFVGGFINKAELNSLEDFNRAVLNKSLEPYGEKVPNTIPVGRKAIAYVDNQLGKKYNDLLPKLNWKPDGQFASDLTGTANDNQRLLTPEQQTQWRKNVEHVMDNIDPTTGQMDGEAFKRIESELSYVARENLSSPNPKDRQFGEAINGLRSAMRSTLERSNPNYAPELQQLNQAWATFARAQGASIRNVNNGGIFTPQDLLRDIKGSTSKGMFARGDATLQELADAGADVLPSTVPDLQNKKEGFFERGMWLGLLGGAGAGYGREMLPVIAGTAGVGGTLYSKPGISALNNAVKSAPNIGTGASQSPALGAAAATAQEQGQE